MTQIQVMWLESSPLVNSHSKNGVFCKSNSDVPINCNFPLVSISSCSACSLHCGLIWPPDCYLQKQRTLMWFGIKKEKGKNPLGQHNVMRQSVKGTKWITNCRVGLWVGGWSQWYFSIPRWLACWQGGAKKLETVSVCGGGEGVGGSVCQKLGFYGSIWTAYGEIRERKRERTKAVSLFEYQSPSLFGQAGFACWVFSQSPGVSRGGARWVEIAVFVVLRVWLLWEQDFSQQGSPSTGHTSDLTLMSSFFYFITTDTWSEVKPESCHHHSILIITLSYLIFMSLAMFMLWDRILVP